MPSYFIWIFYRQMLQIFTANESQNIRETKILELSKRVKFPEHFYLIFVLWWEWVGKYLPLVNFWSFKWILSFTKENAMIWKMWTDTLWLSEFPFLEKWENSMYLLPWKKLWSVYRMGCRWIWGIKLVDKNGNLSNEIDIRKSTTLHDQTVI